MPPLSGLDSVINVAYSDPRPSPVHRSQGTAVDSPSTRRHSHQQTANGTAFAFSTPASSSPSSPPQSRLSTMHAFDPFSPTQTFRRIENRERTSSTTTVDFDDLCSASPVSAPSNSNSSSSWNGKPKKSVRFDSRCHIKRIPSLEDSQHEVTERWYSHEEYSSFKKDASYTLYMAQHQPQAVDDVRMCFRGLEGREERQWKRRRNERRQYAQHVIASWRQHGEALALPGLATKFIDVRALAQQDAMDAMRYQQQPCAIPVQRSSQQQWQQQRRPSPLIFDDQWLTALDDTISYSPATQAQQQQQQRQFKSVSDLLTFANVPELDFSDDWITDVARSSSTLVRS